MFVYEKEKKNYQIIQISQIIMKCNKHIIKSGYLNFFKSKKEASPRVNGALVQTRWT